MSPGIVSLVDFDRSVGLDKLKRLRIAITMKAMVRTVGARRNSTLATETLEWLEDAAICFGKSVRVVGRSKSLISLCCIAVLNL